MRSDNMKARQHRQAAHPIGCWVAEPSVNCVRPLSACSVKGAHRRHQHLASLPRQHCLHSGKQLFKFLGECRILATHWIVQNVLSNGLPNVSVQAHRVQGPQTPRIARVVHLKTPKSFCAGTHKSMPDVPDLPRVVEVLRLKKTQKAK